MKSLTDRYFEWKNNLCADSFTAFDALEIPQYITGMVETIYEDDYVEHNRVLKVDGAYISEWDLDDLIDRYARTEKEMVSTMLPIEALLERCLR